MEATELITMEPGFKLNLEARYKVPFRNNMAVLTILTVLVYLAVAAAHHAAATKGSFRPALGADTRTIYFELLLALPFLYIYIHTYFLLAKRGIHYLKDAQFGFIVKEHMTISKVFDTPSGINIYWLASDEIKTFVPDPYRHFREGDTVFIYYLKHSKEYLAYEL